MAGRQAAAVAASSTWIDTSGIRQPAGEVHAWLPGTNQTLCGLALSRSRLRSFAHVPFSYTGTDVTLPSDEVRHVCPRCTAATGGRRDRRPWTRVAPRP